MINFSLGNGTLVDFRNLILKGHLGDCWLLGAMAAFSEKSDIFEVLLLI